MVLQLFDRDDHVSRSVSINWIAIVVVLTMTALVVGGVHYWHDVQVERHTPLVLAEAQRRQAEGEFASALAYYETYLGYRPDDASAIAEHALLKAKLVRGTPDAAAAFYSLARAANRAPERMDVRRELVRLGIRLNRLNDCRKDLERLVAEAPDDPEVLRLSARAAVQQRQFELARKRYEQCLKLGENDTPTALELLRLLSVELKDFDAADALLAGLLASHPEDQSLQIDAAGYYFGRGKLDQAETHLTAALKDASAPNPALYQLQSEIARLRNRPRDLEASLTRLAALSDSDRRVELELAELELRLGRRGAAGERLLRIARDEAATLEQLWQAMLLLESAGQSEQLPELKTLLKTRDRNGPYLVSLTMRDRMAQRDWRGALEISRSLMNQSSVSARLSAQVSLWRADCFAQVGDVDGQLSSLRRAVETDERNADARGRLARLLFQTGLVQEAQTQYALLISQSPRYALEFVGLLHESLSPAAAFRLTRAEVDALFQRWRESAPNQALPVLCRLELVRRLSEADAAGELIDEGLRRWPEEAGFHLAQIHRLGRAGEWTKAFVQLDEAEKHCGVQPWLLTTRLACLDAAAPDDVALRLEACVEQFRRLDRDGQAQVLPQLQHSLRRANVDPAVVKSLTEKYGADNPHDPAAMLSLLQQSLDAGEQDAARKRLDDLRSSLGDDAPTYLLAAAMVNLQAARTGDEAAIASTQAALEQLAALPAPPTLVLLALRADLALVEQRPLEAIGHLQQALRAGDQRLTTLTQTLTLMTAVGHLDRTVAFLKNLIAAAADSAPRSESRQTAPHLRDLESLRLALEPLLDQSWPLMLVAFRLDLEQGNIAAAEETLARAEKLVPQQPLIMANRLAFTERHAPDRLSEIIAEAQRWLSPVDQGRLLPAYLVRVKRPDDAQKALQLAARRRAERRALVSHLDSLAEESSAGETRGD